jgi:hypothetical protein
LLKIIEAIERSAPRPRSPGSRKKISIGNFDKRRRVGDVVRQKIQIFISERMEGIIAQNDDVLVEPLDFSLGYAASYIVSREQTIFQFSEPG